MEFVGQPGTSWACNILGVPGLSTLDVDDDEGEVVIGIRPKSSPLPRRRSSVTDDDSEPELPLNGSRRVSFADAKGLSLVNVKEFDTWDVPKLPEYDSSEGEGKDAEEYFLSAVNFSLPVSTKELFVKVREKKVELETTEFIPGTTILKGVIRVLNISFTKAVYVRTTLDTWSTHFDLLAEYIPGSSDGLMDCFSFKLTLVPPFGEQGTRVDFCLRYETPVGTFWNNNNNRNYVLFCHQRAKEREKKPQKENVNKKSCLKTVGQTFSTVETFSAMEASSQENISTELSKHGEEVNTVKAKQISDGQSGASEKDGQKLQDESRENCSRRSRRKATRMAGVRDYFAQRGGGSNDTERDESPPEAKQATQEANPAEKHSDVQSFSERSSASGGSHLGSEYLETYSEPLLDVLNDTSPAHDYTSNSEPEKSEHINWADSATLTGGESATDVPDNALHSNDEPAPAECQDFNESVSKAEGSSQRQGMSYECTCNIAAESADSVISAVSSESLVSQTNSFTFGTVVAPLYHQVFGRVGSKSQSVGDWGNPVRATLNVGDLTQSYPRTERRDISCCVPTDASGSDDKVHGNVIKTEESNQEFSDATSISPPIVEEETNLSVTANDILSREGTLQDPAEIIHSDQRHTNPSEVPKTISGDTVVHPHTVNLLNTDLLIPQILTESLHLQGETQEDGLAYHLESQTAAETPQVQLPEHTCAQVQTFLDGPLAQNETQEVVTSLGTSFMSLQPSQSVSEWFSDEINQQTSSKTLTISANISTSERDKLLEALHDLNLNHSATKGTENSSASCSENVEEQNVTTPETSLETQDETNNVEEGNKVASNSHKDETKHSAEIKEIGEVAESMTKAMIINYHSDMFVVLKEEDTFKDEAIIVSENIELHDMEAAVSKQETFSLTDTTEVKNWEMMVEEEEVIILTDEEESEAISLKAEDSEAVDKDLGERLGDTWIKTALEKKAEKVNDKTEETTDVLENVLEYAPATNTEKTGGEEELVQDVEKREEQMKTQSEKEKDFAVIQEINIESSNVQEEEVIEGEEAMEIHLNDDDEAGVEWESHEKPMGENVEEEKPDYKEENLVDETGKSEIADAESESMTIEDKENEVGCFEERLDITQNKAEDGLSALGNYVQDKRVIDKESTGEGQGARLPTEMHLYEEGDFQSNEDVTHDLSKAARDENEFAAAEGGSCILADEPESDQPFHDSSAESDSDDEVELYMRCLRAVHTGAQAHTGRSKDTGVSAGKRPSVSRSKVLSTPMPSISECLDEEHLSRLPENHEDAGTADIKPTAAALPASSGRESINRNVSWWIKTFSCSNISKTLLYVTLLVMFLVVAYRYDFLACFGLYLISVIWLCCQGERQPVKNNNRIG